MQASNSKSQVSTIPPKNLRLDLLTLELRLNVSEKTAKQKCKLLVEAKPASPQHESVASRLRLDLPGVQLRGVARALDGLWELWASSGVKLRLLRRKSMKENSNYTLYILYHLLCTVCVVYVYKQKQ